MSLTDEILRSVEYTFAELLLLYSLRMHTLYKNRHLWIFHNLALPSQTKLVLISLVIKDLVSEAKAKAKAKAKTFFSRPRPRI